MAFPRPTDEFAARSAVNETRLFQALEREWKDAFQDNATQVDATIVRNFLDDVLFQTRRLLFSKMSSSRAMEYLSEFQFTPPEPPPVHVMAGRAIEE